MPADPHDPSVLLAYYAAVHAHTMDYLNTLTAPELDRVPNEPQWTPMPTVGVRLFSVINDGTEHVGQIGLHPWLDRNAPPVPGVGGGEEARRLRGGRTLSR